MPILFLKRLLFIYSFIPIIGEPSKTGIKQKKIPQPERDEELWQLMSGLGIQHLYEVLREERITTNRIWELTHEDLKDMGMKIGDVKDFDQAKLEYKGNKGFHFHSYF